MIRLRTEFEQTPVISSSQVGLIVSDFKCSSGKGQVGAENNSEISMCAAPDSLAKVGYSLGLSVTMLEFFQTNYDIKYSLPKCGNQ